MSLKVTKMRRVLIRNAKEDEGTFKMNFSFSSRFKCNYNLPERAIRGFWSTKKQIIKEDETVRV